MNSDIELIGYGDGAGRRLEQATRWLGAFETRYSRFDPSSELSRLNAASGTPSRVSPGLLRLVQLSLSLAARSGGLFDPTVLRALEAAGYDRSFEDVIDSSSADTAADSSGITWQAVHVNPATRTVLLPEGSGLDLGGIAKGWAVDRMADIIRMPGLVNAGGDIFASGAPADGDRWLVGVEDPFEPQRDLAVLAIADRGVATSSSLRRRWFDGRHWSHHLIDPRTGSPSASDAVQVTAIAPSAMLADYHAKVALLLGVDAGLRYLDREPEVEGLIVAGHRSISLSAAFERYLVQFQATVA